MKKNTDKFYFSAYSEDNGFLFPMERPEFVEEKDLRGFFKECVNYHLGLNMRTRDIDRFIRTGYRRIKGERKNLYYYFSYEK